MAGPSAEAVGEAGRGAGVEEIVSSLYHRKQ